MTVTELNAFLQQSLADRKLSGGEKAAFAAWLTANVTTDQHRGVIRHAVFDAARGASASLDSAQLLEWLEETLKVVLPVTSPVAPVSAAAAVKSEAFFSPGLDCLNRIVHRFSSARQSADVCVFTITDDRITWAILDAHRRGVTIRIITDNEKAYDPGSDVLRLRDAGVPLKVDETPYHMHHKYAVFDRTHLLNGSYNWTRSAADSNEENITDTTDPALVAAFVRAFDTLWAGL